MINYELAKKLKDSGFRQFGDGDALLIHNPDISESEQTVGRIPWCQYVYLARHSDNMVYSPTLSELIVACGEQVRSIHSPRLAHWVATNNKIGENGSYEIQGTGSTPEEAVAKLYLQIKSND